MPFLFRYRGHNYNKSEIEFIRKLIADNSTLSRRALSAKLSQAWNWFQPNGNLRDAKARGLMLALHRAGLITLPPQRWVPPNNAVLRRRRKVELPIFEPIAGPLSTLRPLEFREVRRHKDEALFDALIEDQHYLGYSRPVGEHLKYLIYSKDVPVACLAWSSAPRHLGARDKFIGWSQSKRRRNIHLLAYNTRFLILRWAQVPHLASHILGQAARRISRDWQEFYGHPVLFLETFIDPARFRGTCYKAANWIRLGVTTGRGKDAPTKKPNRSIKELWAYPLTRDFRARLCA